MEIEPRQLTHAERGVLALLLSQDFPGVEELRAQTGEVVVVGRCDCGCPSVALARPDRPRPRSRSALTPIEGRVGGVHGAPPIELLLFAGDGELTYLELVWYGESAPDTWPSLDEIELVEIDRWPAFRDS
jgi:hypothetical protein